MIKRLAILIILAAAGVVVAKKLQSRSAAATTRTSTAPAPRPLAAETLPPATGNVPQPHGAPEHAAAEPAASEPAASEPAASEPAADEHTHELRPSPVPRGRPQWTPPADSSGTGRHAAHGKGDAG